VPSEADFSYTPAAEEDYSYQSTEQPADSFETPSYQTSYESDSFSFKPSTETEAMPAGFVSETSDEPVEEISSEETLEEFQTSMEAPQTFEPETAWSQPAETEDYYSKEPAISYEAPAFETTGAAYEAAEPQAFETETAVAETEYEPGLSTSDYQLEANESFEAPQAEFDSTAQTFETPSYETPNYEASNYEAESFAPTNGAAYDSGAAENGTSESYATAEAPVETVAESVVQQAAKSRFSERNVDLPIEVSEDERRLHNDARRFARLLVSEIKLYNEQKVKEGREGNDLYERLREAIDRSREMYDKRVQPPVAAKFDYFHYELVSNLAEGDSNKLGTSYPGASV
jgi:hypothetical protein